MTDLIKRLREADSYNKKYYALDPLHQEAADRIEELEKQCSFYARSDQFLVEEIKELEAKLTKAVEYFKKLDRRGDTLEFFDPVVHEIVTAALADLGGR